MGGLHNRSCIDRVVSGRELRALLHVVRWCHNIPTEAQVDATDVCHQLIDDNELLVVGPTQLRNS